ncbi:MAG: right-handed parallel beta-helix repeat-containing protein, partial [Lachnospiraceae bacterium]|nr:right-handed parallel beta-helix repeat-containing protein [Lachnospiraceae bacterium]
NVLHYAPGEYHTGNVELPSHTSVVIDEGAVIYGSFTAICGNDIRVCGYGIIDGSSEERTDDTGVLPYSYYDRPHRCDLTKEENLKSVLSSDRMLNGCLRFYNCRDFSVEGVILRDSAAFTVIPANCDGFVIDNVKTIGMWRFNSDGIDLFNSRNAVIRNCFLRNFDDCIVIKGIRGWDTANNENILVENCVIWCDWGSALEIGAETNADLYRNIVFRNCDVIHGASVMMRIQNSNRADIRNVRFENIRTEFSRYCLPRKMMEEGVPYEGKPNTRQPRLFHLMIRQDTPYSDIPLSGTVDNVSIDGLHVYLDDEVSMPESDIQGKDRTHMIRNVRIGYVTVNGKPVPDFSRYVTVNAFTDNIIFDNNAIGGEKL